MTLDLPLCADLADMEGNARIIKQPAIVAIPTKSHPCKACGETIPARVACVSRSQLTKHRKWTWHFHLACAPFPAKPLSERRALRWLAEVLRAARTTGDVPEAAWEVLGALRSEGVPF